MQRDMMEEGLAGDYIFPSVCKSSNWINASFLSHSQTKSLPLALLISFYVQNEYHIHMFMP